MNIYGYPTDILTAEEVGAFGAALLAGVGIGAWATTDAVCEAAIHIAQQIQPKPAVGKIYADGYAMFRRLYPALHSMRFECS